MECFVSSVEQIGPNQVGRLDSPTVYPVIKWNADEVVASDVADLQKCRKVTISIVRRSEAAVWVEEPINESSAVCKNAETRLFKWTVEDSPAFRNVTVTGADFR